MTFSDPIKRKEYNKIYYEKKIKSTNLPDIYFVNWWYKLTKVNNQFKERSWLPIWTYNIKLCFKEMRDLKLLRPKIVIRKDKKIIHTSQ